ncbi:PREDICTED: uncharacterized protein LOC108748108 [Trachymyrmex septentrionalis]|uniref:uncharacterized protein LOC108748108 n=1 Tax=Trachymyrmex septentrionalis TaxID=34720 RepID=UPI00084F1157|nr:PREDICTED: uncharacterized protein LOC108748108 [Trachymyrmex septentrionalis]
MSNRLISNRRKKKLTNGFQFDVGYVENYTKLTTNKAKCNHCSEVFSYKYVLELPCHLRLVYPDKLTEKEKEDRKISWIWNYFTPGNNMTATCNSCKFSHSIFKN